VGATNISFDDEKWKNKIDALMKKIKETIPLPDCLALAVV